MVTTQRRRRSELEATVTTDFAIMLCPWSAHAAQSQLAIVKEYDHACTPGMHSWLLGTFNEATGC